MQTQRSTFAVLLCTVLSVAAVSQPAWAVDGPLNKRSLSALTAKTKLSANQLAKGERLAKLHAKKPTLVQQALALASSTHNHGSGDLSNRISSLRSQFTSRSVRDAIGTLGNAAGIREASKDW